MIINVNYIQNVAIMSPIGKITIGVGDVALRNKISELLDGGHKNIVANLSQVSIIDSSGIGELVNVYTTVSNQGGQFKLCALPSKIHNLLVLTQLITVFEVFDTEEEAIFSF
ncbi:MAG: STAS domain-containing protein [Chitinophagales bacterium]